MLFFSPSYSIINKSSISNQRTMLHVRDIDKTQGNLFNSNSARSIENPIWKRLTRNQNKAADF